MAKKGFHDINIFATTDTDTAAKLEQVIFNKDIASAGYSIDNVVKRRFTLVASTGPIDIYPPELVGDKVEYFMKITYATAETTTANRIITVTADTFATTGKNFSAGIVDASLTITSSAPANDVEVEVIYWVESV